MSKNRDKKVIKNLLKVKNIVAVASGKGGVGKSSVAAGIAATMSRKGMKTGILDADIYGPSIPEIFGVNEKPLSENGLIQPVVVQGIKLMSIGFITEMKNAVIWRGPLLSSAIRQFLEEVDWGELDCLVIDLPPGTGDASLTIAQTIPVSGVVIVTTPEPAAAAIAGKAVSMFKSMEVNIFGIVENMSYFSCPGCGTRSDIFRQGGSKALLEETGLTLLGDIPVIVGFSSLQMGVTEKIFDEITEKIELKGGLKWQQ